jgi:hypothetical protein
MARSTSTIFPKIGRYFKARRAAADKNMDFEFMGAIEKQYRLLDKYDPAENLVLDYTELFVQFGYLALFGAAFPAAMAFAAATNYIETRTDGYKLLHDYRRVVPSRVRHPDTVLIRTSRNSFIFKV